MLCGIRMALTSEFETSDVFIIAVVEIYIAQRWDASIKTKLIRTLKRILSMFEKFLDGKALDQGLRTCLTAHVQTVYKLRRNSFACP